MTFPSSVTVRELPLFPLPNVVLFPGQPLPLHIFEFRYRMMVNTVLESDGRFGVVMFDPTDNSIASVGCCAEITNHHRLPDDRMKVMTFGQQRFRVLNYVRERPFRVGLVEWIEDQPSDQDLQPLTQQVDLLLRDVIHLTAKLMGQEPRIPESIPDTPLQLSYWIAHNLHNAADEQQNLLEMLTTAERLEREAEILSSTRSSFAARVALKDAFPRDALQD
ncbi:MAG: LON peptidase substrate-binding domain-containing protein [Cyanobacteria bacterium J06638_22]